jgi:hypothetical protein
MMMSVCADVTDAEISDLVAAAGEVLSEGELVAAQVPVDKDSVGFQCRYRRCRAATPKPSSQLGYAGRGTLLAVARRGRMVYASSAPGPPKFPRLDVLMPIVSNVTGSCRVTSIT